MSMRSERDKIAVPKLFVDADVRASQGVTLSAMLLSGELDAIVHYHPPRELRPGAGADQAPLCRSGCGRAGVFCGNGYFSDQCISGGIRTTLLAETPDLPMRLYDAVERSQPAMHNDGHYPWLHGVERNRAAIEMLCRYAFEQGITERRLAIDALFAPELLTT